MLNESTTNTNNHNNHRKCRPDECGYAMCPSIDPIHHGLIPCWRMAAIQAERGSEQWRFAEYFPPKSPCTYNLRPISSNN